MDKFTAFAGLAVALPRPNIDTDQIIPKQFLRSVKRTGFGAFLFNDWRYTTSADLDSDVSKLPLNRNFPLNFPRYKGAEILLAGPNFGCGSSREHAVWALQEYGFRTVVSASFGDIFRINSAKNGLLAVSVEDSAVKRMIAQCEETEGYRLSVDLEKQTITEPGGEAHSFDIEQASKQRLLEGLDDIAVTLRYADQIREYERSRSKAEPWLFDAG